MYYARGVQVINKVFQATKFSILILYLSIQYKHIYNFLDTERPTSDIPEPPKTTTPKSEPTTTKPTAMPGNDLVTVCLSIASDHIKCSHL